MSLRLEGALFVEIENKTIEKTNETKELITILLT